MMRCIVIVLFLLSLIRGQEVIDISVKGISDGNREDTQKDRLEAITDAKRQACEKAGITIRSETTVENFQTVYDLVETKAESVLLPGFQIIDIGYMEDGTYQVVLTGKIHVVEETEPISAKQLRYAHSLKQRGNHAQCRSILEKYMADESPDTPEEEKEEAHYLYIKWGYSFNIAEDVQRFISYYPESDRCETLESFAVFSGKPVYMHEFSYEPGEAAWENTAYSRDDHSFEKKLTVTADTIVFRDFRNAEKSLVMLYQLFQTENDVTENTGYLLLLSFHDTNIRNNPERIPEPVVVLDRFRVFRQGGSPTFQHSSSGTWFDPFSLRYFQISGDTPEGEGPYSQTITFSVYQKGF